MSVAAFPLPDELLLYICKLVAQPPLPRVAVEMDDNLPPARKIVHTEYVVPLLRLACVCRRWRYLIVGASTLWSSLFVDVDREAALDNVSQLFHTRAAHAPLKVTLIVRQRAHVLELLPEWVAKLRSFQLKVVGLFPGHYSTLFPSGAPLLECLAISYRMDIPNDPRWRVDISNCIFGDGVTPLRALAIVPVQFDFPSDSFPHLTHLYLSLKTTNMQAYDLTGDVLKLLSRTPQLQYLHISSVPIDSLPDPKNVPCWPIVPLVRLRNVTLIDFHWHFGKHLITHIHAPDDLHLYAFDAHRHAHELDGLLAGSLMMPLFRPFTAFPHLARLKARDGPAVHVVIEGDPMYPSLRAEGRMICTWFPTRPEYATAWLKIIHLIWPFAHIRTLHLALTSADGHYVRYILPYFPSLAHFVVLTLNIQRDAYPALAGLLPTPPPSVSSSLESDPDADALAEQPPHVADAARLGRGILRALTEVLAAPDRCPALRNVALDVWLPCPGGASEAGCAAVARTFAMLADLARARRLRSLRIEPFDFKRWCQARAKGGPRGDVERAVDEGLDVLRGLVDEVVWLADVEDHEGLDSEFGAATRGFYEEECERAERYWELPQYRKPWECI